MLLKQGNEILVLLKTKTTKLGLFFFFNMYNIIGCEKSERFIARQNLECHLPGSFRKAHLPSTCAHDLRELSGVPLRSQGYCGVEIGKSTRLNSSHSG